MRGGFEQGQPQPPYRQSWLARLEQQLAEQASRTSVDTDPTGSRTQDEIRDGAHAHTGDGSRSKSDEAQGMDDEASESGEA